VTQPSITLYVTGWCAYCRRAKNLLETKNLVFSEIDVDDDPRHRDDMLARGSGRTLPQIFIGEKHIGGCDDLIALDRSGELDRIIQGA
jgi:glutaredoxin 3